MPESILATVEQELRRRGSAYTIEQGKRHIKVRVSINGRTETLVCSRSASDWRAAKNQLSILRRMYGDKKS